MKRRWSDDGAADQASDDEFYRRLYCAGGVGIAVFNAKTAQRVFIRICLLCYSDFCVRLELAMSMFGANQSAELV
ncbi:MAG: hypothetical protein ACRDBO_19725 [Lachnospiraceae bacterium]